MTSLYGDVVAERSRRPRRFGDLADPDLTYEDVNPLCGDRIRMQVRLGGGAGEGIAAVRFRGDACAIAVAAADLVAEMAEGLEPAAAARIDRASLLAALGGTVRPARLGCVTLPLSVLHHALGHGGRSR